MKDAVDTHHLDGEVVGPPTGPQRQDHATEPAAQLTGQVRVHRPIVAGLCRPQQKQVSERASERGVSE